MQFHHPRDQLVLGTVRFHAQLGSAYNQSKQGGFWSARPTLGISRGRYVAGKTQTGRATITVTSTAAQTPTRRAAS